MKPGFTPRLGCVAFAPSAFGSQRSRAVGFVALAWIATVWGMGMTAPAGAIGPAAGVEPVSPPRAAQPAEAPAPRAESAILRALHESFRFRHPQGWVGIGLSCSDCSLESDDKGTVWGFESPPRIEYVDPGSPAERAGVRRGDVLVEIDAMPITSRDAGRRFGTVQPGDKVRWTYERGGKKHQTTLTVEEHPDAAVGVHPEIAAEIESALERLQEEQERLSDADGELEIEDARRMLEMARQEMENARAALERDASVPRKTPRPPAVIWAPDVPAPPAPPQRHNLRYEGTIAGSQVEVRGSGAVVVTEDDEDEIVITTPDATIRIRKKKM